MQDSTQQDASTPSVLFSAARTPALGSTDHAFDNIAQAGKDAHRKGILRSAQQIEQFASFLDGCDATCLHLHAQVHELCLYISLTT
jgi:hypothetical protein